MKSRVGKQILDVLTTGMYSDPQMAIREYIQNAADSIDGLRRADHSNHKECSIHIRINGEKRQITIEDNGLGVSRVEVIDRLCTLGRSNKNQLSQRGYRGIGRLGGLAYCDSLRFETRSTSAEPVSIVEWNSKYLTSILAKGYANASLAAILPKICTHKFETRKHEPAHFFRVTMENVRRFHSDKLMNHETLFRYLSHTAPVGFDSERFSYAAKVIEYCACVQGNSEFAVYLNGEKISKPYSDQFHISDQLEDQIQDVELFEFKNSMGKVIARGWFSKTNLYGSIMSSNKCRGIRIRQGNIEVGDESYLTQFFTEPRFSTWHIGEIHVVPVIKLNARRDGFEESSDYEALLERFSALCRHLSVLCRAASKKRSRAGLFESKIADLEALTHVPFFMDKSHLRTHANQLKSNLEVLAAQQEALQGETNRHRYVVLKARDRIDQMISHAKFVPDLIDSRKLNPKDCKSVLLQVCRDILNMEQVNSKYHLITLLLKDYLRQ